MDRVKGKVALVTGAARGMGRAIAVRLAEEGANVIAVDICHQIESIPYELGAASELAETKKLIEKTGRKAITASADVRIVSELQAAVDAGVKEFGHLDIVSANAGIWSSAPFVDMTDKMYHDMINVQLHGVYYTCKATIPQMIKQGKGGSIVITSSTAGMTGFPNQIHYNIAKHGVIGLMRTLVNEVGPNFIRVNSIHPTSTNTKMIMNKAIWEAYAPGIENPTEADFGKLFASMNALPIPWMEPVDIANAVLWLGSDEARYVTGVTLPIDAGFLVKV